MTDFLSAIMLALLLLAQSADSRRVEEVAPGIERTEIRRGDFSTDGPPGDRWTINVLTVDPALYRLDLGQAMDEVAGAELTTSLAERYGAVAAVNGGYFRTTGVARGEPVGVLEIGGRILSEPVRNRASLAVRNDRAGVSIAIAHYALAAELAVAGKVGRKVDGLNRPREKDELIVFTPEFHRTTLTGGDGVEFVVEGGRVVSIADGRGSVAIPRAGLVVSASGSARQWALRNLRRGARVGLKTRLRAEPSPGFRPDYILGAGPQLISAGKPIIQSEEKSYAESFFRGRHPRTAIGLRRDGKLLLVVVDGRQPKKSVGMTIPELAGLMAELGCVEALNLDGGGSSTMVVKNRIVNSPSDATGERPVSDALLVRARQGERF